MNILVDFVLTNSLSYFSFQPVLHDWCNKGRGMYYIVRLPDTNFHKKTAYYKDCMKLSGIEDNIYVSILEGVPTHPATIFKMAAIF